MNKTMTQEHATLEQHIKKATTLTNFVSAFVAAVLAIGVGYGFYYRTSDTLDAHTQDIKEVKSDVAIIKNDIQAVDVFKGVSKVEVQGMNEKINTLEQNMNKMDEKLDKILLQTR
jgi:peptidoglycan hydrolase CwlO-like protein